MIKYNGNGIREDGLIDLKCQVQSISLKPIIDEIVSVVVTEVMMKIDDELGDFKTCARIEAEKIVKKVIDTELNKELKKSDEGGEGFTLSYLVESATKRQLKKMFPDVLEELNKERLD